VVLSHPQASAQCARFIRERIPNAAVRAASSTAEAVRSVSLSRDPWAALGAPSAARLYDCAVLAEGVEDDDPFAKPEQFLVDRHGRADGTCPEHHNTRNFPGGDCVICGRRCRSVPVPPEDQPEVGQPKELPAHLRRQMVHSLVKQLLQREKQN
jgi:hypothetical protein